MKPITFFRCIVFSLATIIISSGCRNPRGKFDFDPKKAALHVRPYTVLKQYIDSFVVERERLYRKVEDKAYFDTAFDIPNAELFNKDAILALLSAPGAEGLRIYFGKKTSHDSTNGNIVMVLLPVDANNKDIKTRLIVNDRTGALHIPGISSANARTGGRTGLDDAEGLEEGQRCPTICND